MISRPEAVANVIMEAVNATVAQPVAG
jgi:hypothetical protein